MRRVDTRRLQEAAAVGGGDGGRGGPRVAAVPRVHELREVRGRADASAAHGPDLPAARAAAGAPRGLGDRQNRLHGTMTQHWRLFRSPVPRCDNKGAMKDLYMMIECYFSDYRYFLKFIFKNL